MTGKELNVATDNSAPLNEWRVEVKIKNNLLYQRIKNSGSESIAAFAKSANVTYSSVIDLINFRTLPIREDGSLKVITEGLISYFKCTVYDLFTPEQLEFKTNKKYEVTLSTPELKQLVNLQNDNSDPMLPLIKEDEAKQLYKFLDKLQERTRKIIEMRFFDGMLYHEIATTYDLSLERVRQIEMKGIRQLRWRYNNEKENEGNQSDR